MAQRDRSLRLGGFVAVGDRVELDGAMTTQIAHELDQRARAAEIGRNIGQGSEGKPSPVAWAADAGAVVASSGDLGVTFGFIRQNTPQPGQPEAIPFITVWRRPDPKGPWRYIAE